MSSAGNKIRGSANQVALGASWKQLKAERTHSTFPDWDQQHCATRCTSVSNGNGEHGQGHPVNHDCSAPSSRPWVVVLVRPEFGHVCRMKHFSCGCNSAVQLAELHLLISKELSWVTAHTSAQLCCHNMDGGGAGRYSEA